MHERVAHGSHAQRNQRVLAFHFGLLRNGCQVAFPRARQGFQLAERFLGVRLGRGRVRCESDIRTSRAKGAMRDFMFSVLLFLFFDFNSVSEICLFLARL